MAANHKFIEHSATGAAMTETPIPEQTTPTEKRKRSQAENLDLVRQAWPWVFFAVLVLIFSIASKMKNDVNFLSVRSVQGILEYCVMILLVGLAETFIIITGGIDLSVGWTVGFASVIAAQVMQRLYAAGAPPIEVIGFGVLGGVLVAVLPGLLNGLLVAKVKVPSFIATLGVGTLVEGIALIRSGGYPVAKQPPYLGAIGNGYLLRFWPGHGFHFFSIPKAATTADLPDIISLIPIIVVIAVIVTFTCWFILAKTQFGQHLYAIGGNKEASLRAGIPVERTLIKVYILASVLAGITGIIWTSRFTSGAYNAGEPLTMTAIAAVVIGGASLFGGEGTIVGTIIGSLIIATIQYGLVILGVVPFWQYVAVGIVLILAVVVDQFGRRLGK
jgi:ribose/xylose/arabinose/galactoside ABC-type transport system permease subunit